MNRDTTDPNELLRQFREAMISSDRVPALGRWRRTITRADGSVEEHVFGNIVTATGLDEIAALAVGGTASAANYIAIGTVTAQPSLGSVITGIGESDRKAGATVTSSKEVMILVATWGGAADGLTGVALASASITNHADSGEGTPFNISNSVNTTLAASDFLKLQAEIQIGSHNL